MAKTYTLSSELLKKVKIDEPIYLTDILLIFTQRGNPYKISCDLNDVVINLYKAVEQNKEFISLWLNLMSFNPKPFEYIDIDITDELCDETKFLKLCRATNGSKNLIVYSNQCITTHSIQNELVNFENDYIRILDRDTARTELNQVVSGDTIINSIVAKNNSNVNDCEN